MGTQSEVLRSYKWLNQQCYWPSMCKMVQEYIHLWNLLTSQIRNSSPIGLIQPLPIPCQVWDDITIDFIKGLPISNGKDTILVVVDFLSKLAHFLTLLHPYTIKVVVKEFMEWVVKLHGKPRSSIRDQDPIFISYFWN